MILLFLLFGFGVILCYASCVVSSKANEKDNLNAMQINSNKHKNL